MDRGIKRIHTGVSCKKCKEIKDKIKEGFTGIFCENRRSFELAQDSVKWLVLLLWAVVAILGTCGCNQITNYFTTKKTFTLF